jgi:hypothetical protein
MPRKRNNKNKKQRKKLTYEGPQTRAQFERSQRAVVPKPSAIASQQLKPYKMSANLKQKICSVTDPFCDDARGGRWLDGLAFATAPFSARAHITMSTLSNGGTVSYFAPINCPYGTLSTASYSAGNYTMGGAYASTTGSVSVGVYFTGFRVVSAGLVIRNLTSVMNTSGYVIVTREAVYPAPAAVVAAGNMVNPQVTTHPISPGMEVPVIHRPLGSAARDFALFTASTATPITDPAWDVIKVEIVGAPVSAVSLDIEIYYNYEMQLVDGSVLAQVVPKSSVSNPVVNNIANKVNDALVNGNHGSLKDLEKSAVNQIEKAVKNEAKDLAKELLHI